MNIPIENLSVIEIWNHKVYKIYGDNDAMDRMQDKDDIRVCYIDSPEVSVASTKDEDEDDESTSRPNNYGYYNYGSSYYKPKVVEHPDDIILVQVVLRKKEKVSSSYYYRPTESFGVFGIPMIISCRLGSTYEEVHEIVAKKLVRFFDDPSVLDFPEASEVDSGMDIDEKKENSAPQPSMDSSIPDSSMDIDDEAETPENSAIPQTSMDSSVPDSENAAQSSVDDNEN